MTGLLDRLICSLSQAGRARSEAEIERARRVLELKVNSFSFINMHLPTHVGDCVPYMRSADNFRIDISELLHVDNVKKGYQASSRVDYERRMLFWNERRLNLSYMDQVLKFFALQGEYKSESTPMLKLTHAESLYNSN